MKNLVPLKVKIGLRANGHADHPDWNTIGLADANSHMYYGWQYDKTSGHKQVSGDSPYGMQWGMLLVTDEFAKKAISTFPTLVTQLTDGEAETFWNTRVKAHMPENKSNLEQLQALETELSLKESLSQDTTALKVQIAKALDPDDAEPGIEKDNLKYFADAKIALDMKIVTKDYTGDLDT